MIIMTGTKGSGSMAGRPPRRAATGLFLVLFLIATPVLANGTLQPEWGVRHATVATQGPGELVLAGDRRVVRHARVAGIPFTLNYLFEDDRLWQVRLFSRARHEDPGLYLDDHAHVQGVLAGIYGKPDAAEAEWTDDQLMDRPEYHGQAVQVGFLTLVAGWEHADARVFLTLERQSFRPVQRLILTDPGVDLR